MLSCSFTCGQINNCQSYEFGYNVVLLMSNLDAQQTHLRGQFFEKMFILGCGQINNCHSCESGHTLLCYLCHTQMLNKPTSDASLLNKSSCLVAALGVAKLIAIIYLNLVTLCCATYVRLMFNKSSSEARGGFV